MKYSIAYSSKTGNTKLLAETIRKALPSNDCVYFGAPDIKALDAERIYAGFWTYAGSCDENFASFLKKIDGREVFLFGTAGAKNADYMEKVLHHVSNILNKNVKIIGLFMCQGRMPASVRQSYEKMLLCPAKAAVAQAKLENFDAALSHPDKDDLKKLKKAISAVITI